MKYLFEILVPTIYGDTEKPIKTKHHKRWDEEVQKISGGLTILSPVKGKWMYKDTNHQERVIPVRIMCNESEMREIVRITMSHYRQKAVMYYVISEEVRIILKDELHMLDEAIN